MSTRIRTRLHTLRLVRESFSVNGAEIPTHVRSPRDVYALMLPYTKREVAESFWILALNTQHALIGDPIVISRGILYSSLVHPREVFRAAIVAGAAAIILAHNHPSGILVPSPDDRAITNQLVEAGRLLDIPVHDHIIIGNGYTSFAEQGLL